MSALDTLGVVGSSRTENERRLPIHPHHLTEIPEADRRRLIFERGYGAPFGVEDAALERLAGGLAERRELLTGCDGVLLPKPRPEDLAELRRGAVLWGWPHCVQHREITDLAIERELTLLAFEAMFVWRGEVRELHSFYRNNEMAGYCGVLHALGLHGQAGLYGRPLAAVVLSFGSVSRGAVYALRGRGITDVTVYTQRPPVTVHDRIPGCRYRRMVRRDDHAAAVAADGSLRPLVEVFAEADLVVNGILQDTDRPLMFMAPGDEERLRRGSLIVDVSSDLGMGFPFARPTTFETPTFPVAGATYYAVDHTPSYLWKSATWEVSRVVVAYLGRVLGGPERWREDETLHRAVEILRGKIVNPKISRFQGR
ncbi:MAG: N(5)-(carboxyethyl)ornithine synthase [Acidobacteriota bacterium]|jgi:alanine dehydrogenase